MFSPKRTALYLALSAMTFAAGEASAGCKYIPNPPGSYVCASWIKGSEICNITTGPGAQSGNPAPEVTSATCSITGFNFIDGAEGGGSADPDSEEAPADGAYCASGAFPPGICEPEPPSVAASSFASPSVASPAASKPAKPPKPKDCKPPKPPKGGKPAKPPGHDKSCGDIIVPGNTDGFLTSETVTPTCDDLGGGDFSCEASIEIGVPDGATCADGQPAADFTATEMLAITHFCIGSGSGETCDSIYEICTLGSGDIYDCRDISTQGSTCSTFDSFLTFDPDDPQCGQVRSCID